MEISDIRIKLIQDSSDRLKAVCSITLDDEFVVRDLKVVEGTNGLFVAMPSRKLSVHCLQCRGKNHLRARFCNECGAKLPPARTTGDAGGKLRMHRDIAHPINPTFREIVQSRVIEKYRAESELAKSPDYTPVDIDADFEDKVEEIHEQPEASYAPSEYDQLIAGLNKGSTHETPRERETQNMPATPLSRAPRSADRRRPERNERQAKPSRNAPPRQGQRGDSRRSEGPRPSRQQGQNSRPTPLPSIMSLDVNDTVDEVNGNVAIPGQRPLSHAPRRPSPPVNRRVDERPQARRSEERPIPRMVDEAPVEPRIEEPLARRAEAPPEIQHPVPAAARQQKPGKLEDLPFGAGL